MPEHLVTHDLIPPPLNSTGESPRVQIEMTKNPFPERPELREDLWIAWRQKCKQRQREFARSVRTNLKIGFGLLVIGVGLYLLFTD